MYAAKEFGHGDGVSHVCYRNELDVLPRTPSRRSDTTVSG
jgi:hypothetical protein